MGKFYNRFITHHVLSICLLSTSITFLAPSPAYAVTVSQVQLGIKAEKIFKKMKKYADRGYRQTH